METPTRRVIVVGGGSVGWITAARVAARWHGADTWPTMRVDFQSALCEAGLAPKAITTPEYVAVANYAYHLTP